MLTALRALVATSSVGSLQADVSQRVMMDVLGHSHRSLMLRYAHVLTAMLDDAAARLEAVFPRAAGA